MATTLPEKLYYKIGEVAELARVRTSVLRFWETEFSFLKPEKSTTGQRLYSKREVDLILQVRHLLYDEKFTIEGVKKKISSRGKLVYPGAVSLESSSEVKASLLVELKQELQQIRDML